MAKLTHCPTYIKRVRGKGWAVFCAKKISKGTIFHVSPLLVFSGREARLMSESSLEPYWYEFGTKGRAIALGLGSLLNHSSEPNCSYHFSKAKRTLSFYTLRNISAHEELTHDYGWPKSTYKLFGVQLEDAKKKKKK